MFFLLLISIGIASTAVHVDAGSQAASAESPSSSSEISPVFVDTPRGRVRGRRLVVENVAVDAFFGLPYATARRWKEPVSLAKQNWQGARNATTLSSACPQQLSEKLRKVIEQQGKLQPLSEDCLSLDVYTPVSSKVPERARLPVMVWIHGGSFVHGSGSLYDGEALAALGNVVVVTINYRLGVFGFLQLAPGRTANFGLLDQLAALQWVKENIKFYGGDETKITIFGESAGGAFVGWLLLSAKTSRGLIKRAIMQSGTPTSDWAWRSSERALKDTQRLAEALECNTTDSASMESCMREKDMMCVLKAQSTLVNYSAWSVPPIELLQASPILDGHVIKDSPQALLQSGKGFPIEQAIVGFAEDEATYFFTRSAKLVEKAEQGFSRNEYERFVSERILLSGPNPVISSSNSVKRCLSKQAFAALQKVTEMEFSEGMVINNQSELRDQMFRQFGDILFVCPSVAMLQYLAKTLPVYAYVFTHIDGQFPAWVKATHTAELDYLFGTPMLDKRVSIYGHSGEYFKFNEDERKLSRLLIDLWSSFARSGHPENTEKALPNKEWPAFTPANNRYLQLDTKPDVLHNFHQETCTFWLRQLPELLSAFNGSHGCNKDYHCPYRQGKTGTNVDDSVCTRTSCSCNDMSHTGSFDRSSQSVDFQHAGENVILCILMFLSCAWLLVLLKR